MTQQVTFSSDGDVLTAFLTGELDHHAASDLRLQIDHQVQLLCPEKLVLDFHGVGLMDSSGIGLILGRMRKMEERGGRLALAGLSPRLSATLRLAGISEKRIMEERR